MLTVFQALSMEELYNPKIEPQNFLKHVPVLKSVEVEGRLYTLTFIRQFENASVIHLHVDWNETVDMETIHTRMNRPKFKLRALEGYNCQSDGAGGGTGRVTHRFTVSPALPDDVSGFSFIFEEYDDNWMGEKTGLEIEIKIS
ncbi:hypothetical protein [Bacillus sp. SJS]|uniref:hypothetical protein n=1 Tax=Bacillus sp. SJS TaxID=1423321 RepID=UPI0006921754|nr:hypothetical protein [Bacillus sp. SJS]KZZ84709.1 hypothetical protein AS29_009250 [Bacillus sp. SJS]